MEDSEFYTKLGELLSINSVTRIDTTPEEPYGPGPTAALKYMLDLCERYGFKVKNCGGNRIGWAEIGEGDEMVAVLAHLDVVPAGKGWNYEPYALTIDDDRAYGRGVSDDKGPAMCCVAAMKDILDSGMPLKRRIRIIFGLTEETGGWDDMEWYRENEEKPAFGFTPDADYPALYGEKGILTLNLRMPADKCGLVSISGGDAANVVPSYAEASYIGANNKPVTVTATGKGAHGSMPYDGVNAIASLMEKLAAIPEVTSPLVDFFEEHIGWDYYGGKMGINLCDDKSGRLTLNAGVVKIEDGDAVLTLNIRYPVTFEPEDITGPIEKAAAQYGLTMEVTEYNAPIYMDKNGPIITALVDVYREFTGDHESEPQVIGGGTYARAMDNIVAFGPMFPGRELTEHMANENVLLEDLELNRRIYRAALEKLADL